ncbi:dystrotelin [Tiliqua scincoides]|uniref:dystrotelin n=1 Tax=Tiliqua scincoides TaxID=71010 RepID=UPI003461D024
MDLEQQALNAVQNSIYRKALKLCAVQSLCQLNLTDVSLIRDILLNHQCQAEKRSSLPIQQLLHLLKVLYKRVRLEKPGQVEPKAPELTLNLLTAAYDRNGGGFIQPRSAAAALIALSGDSLLTKYRALFQLYAACAGRRSSKGIRITRNGVRTLLTDLLQILAVVGESCNLHHVEAEMRSCFSGVLGSAVGEERFLTWLQSEPAILLWLPTCHRLSVTKMVTHQVTCNVCNSFPITGLRYRCLKCLNFDLCQVCFFTGQHSKPHKKSHPMMEHCVPVSAKENTKLFFRTIQNNLRQGRCRRKEAQRRKALVMIGEEDFSTCDQALSCSVPAISTEQSVPPDLLPSVHTLDLQPHSPFRYEVSWARQMENNIQSPCQEKPTGQVATSFKADMVKAQELIKALHRERRYLRKQLNKWKDKVQLRSFTQEDRNCKLEAKIQDLIVGQESLKVALQEMRQELKKITAYSKDPLEERSVWNGSGCPPLKASTTRYTKYKPSGLPKITLKPEFFKDTNPAHCENTGVRHAPPGKHSGDGRPERSRDHLSRIMISSSYCSAATKTLFDEETEEEEELQLLMMKLKDALSLQVQSGQPSVLKEEVLSAAEHVSKSFSALTGQVVLPTRKPQVNSTGVSYPGWL